MAFGEFQDKKERGSRTGIEGESVLARKRAGKAASAKKAEQQAEVKKRIEAKREKRISALRKEGKFAEAKQLEDARPREKRLGQEVGVRSASQESKLAQSREMRRAKQQGRQDNENLQMAQTAILTALEVALQYTNFRVATVQSVDEDTSEMTVNYNTYPETTGVANPNNIGEGVPTILFFPDGDPNNNPFAFSFSPYAEGEVTDV